MLIVWMPKGRWTLLSSDGHASLGTYCTLFGPFRILQDKNPTNLAGSGNGPCHKTKTSFFVARFTVLSHFFFMRVLRVMVTEYVFGWIGKKMYREFEQ